MCGYCSHTSGLAGNLKKHIANMHKEMPMKVIDLRKARKDAKKAAKSKQKPGAVTHDVEPGEQMTDDDIHADVGHAATAAAEMAASERAAAAMSAVGMAAAAAAAATGGAFAMPERPAALYDHDRLREMERYAESERLREMNERMEGAMDPRRIDMIVNQIANRINY